MKMDCRPSRVRNNVILPSAETTADKTAEASQLSLLCLANGYCIFTKIPQVNVKIK